jgi:hypothetical protein
MDADRITTCCGKVFALVLERREVEGRGGGIGPGGRGVTFHSFSFCLPLIARLLFLGEMQEATLKPIFLRGIYQLRPQKH